MPFTLEREIKLRFASADAARQAIVRAGAVPFHQRRLQQDFLLDTADGQLRGASAVLRLRVEPERTLLTFKGPVQAAGMKLRDEIESLVTDAAAILAILDRTGFRVWFRYEKYREEFLHGDVIAAVDETPVGVFLELEGAERGITAIAEALGYGPEAYLLDSYRSLFVKDCAGRGVPVTNMLF